MRRVRRVRRVTRVRCVTRLVLVALALALALAALLAALLLIRLRLYMHARSAPCRPLNHDPGTLMRTLSSACSFAGYCLKVKSAMLSGILHSRPGRRARPARVPTAQSDWAPSPRHASPAENPAGADTPVSLGLSPQF